MKRVFIILLTVALFCVGAVMSLALGAVQGFDIDVMRVLRAPRTLLSLAVGGGLSVAGAGIQAIMGNPLADPYTLGVASAAALGATVAICFFGSSAVTVIPLFSFLFAIGYMLLFTFWIRNSLRSGKDMILIGVVAGFFFSSVATLLLVFADPVNWTSSFIWLLGSIKHFELTHSAIVLLLCVVLSFILWLYWKPLDLMAVDNDLAATAGVAVERYRLITLLIASLMTAVCVAHAGIIGFIGLLVPHALRTLGIYSHRILIPLAFLGGAGLLAASDAFARVIASPSEIPVGIVMALLGGPVFLILVQRLR